MQAVIEEVLRNQKSADLSSEDDIKRVAEAISDKLERSVEGDSETAKMLFNSQTLALFQSVAKELKEANAIDKVEDAYNSIVNASKTYNNGTALLALAEAMISLIGMAAELVDGPNG